MRKEKLLLLLFALIFCGCVKKAEKPQMPPLKLQVIDVKEDSIYDTRTFTGKITSKSDIAIQPRVGGYLKSVHYRQGMPVKKGQLLFKIDPAPFLTAVTQAEASLASMQAELTDAQSTYDRSVPLARINAISASSLDQATAKLISAKQNVKAARAALDNANINLSYTTIYSPANGIIGATNTMEGDYVGAGSNNEILNTISVIDSMYVNLYMPYNQFLKMRGKRPAYDNSGIITNARLYLSDGSEYAYNGKYDFTQREIDSSSGTIVLRIIFPNPDGFLKTGQYAKVVTYMGEKRPKMLIPQKCVVQSQGINSVFVVNDQGVVEYRKVELGDTYGEFWIVDSGLHKGEEVLMEGLQKARGGEKIIPYK